jgi:hypothetical protein
MIAACHFPGQIPEAIGVEQRLAELATLEVAHLAQRRVPDDPRSRRGSSLSWTRA